MNYSERALESGTTRERTRHTMYASTLNIYFIIKYLWEELERLNHKKKKRVWIFILIFTITYCCIFEWILYYGMKGSKLMLWIRWRRKVKVLIEFLSMCRGFYKIKYCVFVCACNP